jgi:hypothetical protein
LYKWQDESKTRKEHVFKNPWIGKYKSVFYNGRSNSQILDIMEEEIMEN